MMQALFAPDQPMRLVVSRNAAIAVGVVVLHVLALWALQSGLLQRAAELLVPVQMISEFIEPPAPRVAPPAPAPQSAKQALLRQAVINRPPPPVPAQQPVALADSVPFPQAPVGVATPQLPAPPITEPVAALPSAPPSPSATSAPARLESPTSDADYLQNPKPVYPLISKRLGEQGQVIYSVLIGIDGLPESAQLVKSSGFERLDQAAFAAVMRWRYKPGKRNGVPVAMSFNVPINWVLE